MSQAVWCATCQAAAADTLMRLGSEYSEMELTGKPHCAARSFGHGLLVLSADCHVVRTDCTYWSIFLALDGSMCCCRPLIHLSTVLDAPLACAVLARGLDSVGWNALSVDVPASSDGFCLLDGLSGMGMSEDLFLLPLGDDGDFDWVAASCFSK